MLDRRDRLRGSAIESLETRGLLSVVAPIRSSVFDGPNVDRGAAEVVTFATVRQGSRSSSPGPAGSGLSVLARTARSGPGNLPASSPVVRNNAAPSGAVKRLAAPDPDPRGLPDPLSLIRHNPPATGGDPAAAAPATMPGPSGTAFDPAGAVTLIGWAPSTATPGVGPANPAERAAGPDVRSGTGTGSGPAVTVPTGSLGNISPGLETSGSVAGNDSAAQGVPGVILRPPRVPGAVSDRGASSPAWAGLIDGALHSDWEGVDGELRQFLARLGGLSATPDGPETRPTWPLWIAATAALLLARRGSFGPRRLFGRPVPGSAWASARRPIPVGPWPLGPP
jgi:hypothetical protein